MCRHKVSAVLVALCLLRSVSGFLTPTQRYVAPRGLRSARGASTVSTTVRMSASSGIKVSRRRDVSLSGSEASGAESQPFTSTGLCKGLIMAALVAQSAGVSLLARKTYETCSYNGAVAGLLQEALKLPVALLWLTASRTPASEQLETLKESYGRPRESVVLAVPAACFAAQNVLFFFAHERLPSTTYLVLAQSKTLFTALFSVALLPGRRLSGRQWLSQPILMAGCALCCSGR